MLKPFDLLSPKQVARAIGVSESSLKRWCDQGEIKTVRTVGGHRKLAVAEVLRFIRDSDHQLRSPELLGLPPTSAGASLGLTRSMPKLAEALLSGDEVLSRQIVFDLYLAKHPISVICDEVIAAAFQEIGSRWSCDEADVYQERRGCEIAFRILHDLRRAQPTPKPLRLAIGGTITGDHYALPSAMAEIVLRESGFSATSLGTSIPFASLIRAVKENRPTLFWLSVSHISVNQDFVAEFAALSQSCSTVGTALVVGGRALTEELRERMVYSSYCNTMQQLAEFARALCRTAQAAKGHAVKDVSATKDIKRKSVRQKKK